MNLESNPSLSLSLHFKPQKIQPKRLHFLFLFRPFSVSLFFFQHFSSFLSSLFLCSLFTFILLFIPFWLSPLFLFALFSILYLCLCFSFSFMTEDNTRHPEKWVKAVVRMVTNVWKGGLLLACFWAWLKVLVDGPESTKESALADVFWLGLAAKVCFLWLSDLCVTQTARGTCAGECLSSSPFVFSLSTLILLILPSFLNTWQNSYWKDWATWGGEAEPRGFDGLCRRSEEDRARKTKICGRATQRLGRGNKQTGR